MDDLAQQIRAWADVAAERTGEPVSASEAMDGQGRIARQGAPTPGVRSSRRLVLAAAVVFVVFAGAAVGIARLRRAGHDEVARVRTGAPKATPTDRTTRPRPKSTGRVSFRVLAVHRATHDRMGTLRAATAPDELPDLWADAGLTTAVPAIDFAREVVVSITIPDDACPPTLGSFERDGTTLQPRFIEPDGCTDPLIPKTFVVALDWSTTGPMFRLHLPGQANYGFGDTNIDIKMRTPASAIYDGSGLEDDLRRKFPETVVGAYYDAATLVVSITSAADHDAIQHEIESYNRTQSSASPAIRLAVVANPRSRLDALMAEANRLDSQMRRRGADVNSVGIDPQSATLQIGLQADTSAARTVVLDVLHAKPTEISFTQQDVVPALGGGN